MAMAGQGLNAVPPPRPPSHNYFGTHTNPGNQLYVGNVSCNFIQSLSCEILSMNPSCRTKPAGKISRTFSARRGILFELI